MKSKRCRTRRWPPLFPLDYIVAVALYLVHENALLPSISIIRDPLLAKNGFLDRKLIFLYIRNTLIPYSNPSLTRLHTDLPNPMVFVFKWS